MEVKGDDDIIIHNRNGHLLVNPEGKVTSIYIDDGVEDFTGHFRYITRVDLDEWRSHWSKPVPDELDISDVTYWYKTTEATEEVYQPADPAWRAEVAEWKRREAEENAP